MICKVGVSSSMLRKRKVEQQNGLLKDNLDLRKHLSWTRVPSAQNVFQYRGHRKCDRALPKRHNIGAGNSTYASF